jgi:hypothetical protein
MGANGEPCDNELNRTARTVWHLLRRQVGRNSAAGAGRRRPERGWFYRNPLGGRAPCSVAEHRLLRWGEFEDVPF